MAVHPNSLKNLKPFKKGHTANPGGRPKGSGVTDHLLRLAQEQIDATIGKNKVTMTRAEAMARVLWQGVQDRRDRHHIDCVRIILDRTEGKALERVMQSLDIAGGAIVPRALVPTEKKEVAK